jgi:mono/diheme cytochrome c family protein
MRLRRPGWTAVVLAASALAGGGCGDSPTEASKELIEEGRDIFRSDTFGNEPFWTDTLRLHEVIESSVDPVTALAVGLKVDSDVLPPGLLQQVDLKSPATTVALLKLNAVVGLKGTVVSEGGRDRLARVGTTCALCHSTVDNSVMPGIGRRLDGWANRELNPGAIIALSPALNKAQRDVYQSWGPGFYDARFNIDGKSGPVLIPPAYGLAGSRHATYTGDGDVSYWNAYVAVTQMGGQGSFSDPRLGIARQLSPGMTDLVTPKLGALREYQLSLEAPRPPAGSFDTAAAERGRAVFSGAARCASCHRGEARTEDALHAASETGVDGDWAARSATKRYRTTPLRGLWHRPPYFHDGTAKDLTAVVDHYDRVLGLGLTAPQKVDLVEYLKSI